MCIAVHTRRQQCNWKLTNGFNYSSTSLYQSEMSMRACVRFYSSIRPFSTAYLGRVCIKYLWSASSKRPQDWGPDIKQQKQVGFKSWFKPKPTYTHAHTHAHTWQTSSSLFRGKFALNKQKCFAPPPLTSHTHAHTPLHPSFCSLPSCTHSGQRATVCRCLTSVLSRLLYLFSSLLPCEA